MKKIIALTICVLMLFSLPACSQEESPRDEGKLRIVTTMYPAYDFSREIAGERAEVILLVPPGSEAHSFEPRAKDILSLRGCDLLVCNGGESEAWVPTLVSGCEEDFPILRMLECVEKVEEEKKAGMQTAAHGHGHGHGHGHEIEYDEHVWTSPVNAVTISEAICDELCRIDSEGQDYYRERCAGYTEKLRELDRGFRETVEKAPNKTMIFADRFPARYFVEEYGLDYYAAFPGCTADTEPSAKTVAFLIDRVRENKIPAVFYIEFSNEKMADIICEDTGCKKLLFHCCHTVGADQLEAGLSYLEIMEGNLANLKEALG
ncbi:MAG: metal ABC transporter substrate-binding protein [Candidatus Limivicinus sp.]|jgi:zinc transport system substrate-binding protein